MERRRIEKERFSNLRSSDILFRNFEGLPGKFNKKGERSFAVVLDRERAEDLEAKGWNVKWPKPNPDYPEEEDNRRPYLSIKVAFGKYPARVYLAASADPSEEPVRLGEDEVAKLDWAEFEQVDLIVSPYEWNVHGESGVAAYLEAGKFCLLVDKF